MAASSPLHRDASASRQPSSRGPKADAERPPKGERGSKSSTEGGTQAHTRMPSLRTRRGLAELQGGREHEEPSGVTRRRRVPRTALREAQRDGSAPRRDQLESGARKRVAWPDSAADTGAWLRPEAAKARMIEGSSRYVTRVIICTTEIKTDVTGP
jgi:hypothetical protein